MTMMMVQCQLTCLTTAVVAAVKSDPEEEDDSENVQNVEMLLPVAWDDQGSSGNQSPKLFSGYNRQDRFTTS